LQLSKGSKARKISRTEVKIQIPELEKDYLLLGKDPSKCPAKSEFFSCLLDDWVEAINYICQSKEKP